jgi:hypothetical protein
LHQRANKFPFYFTFFLGFFLLLKVRYHITLDWDWDALADDNHQGVFCIVMHFYKLTFIIKSGKVVLIKLNVLAEEKVLPEYWMFALHT